MRDEIRTLLDEGAGQPRDVLHFDVIRQRARVRRWARRGAALVAAAAIAFTAVPIAHHLITAEPTLPPTRRIPLHGAPLTLGPLHLGVHVATRFDPRFQFTTTDRWSVGELHHTWTMLFAEAVNLNFERWGAVFDPQQSVLGKDDLQPLPQDLVGWLMSHPRLHVIDSTSVTIGGLLARSIDVEVTHPLARQPKPCTTPCVLLGRVADQHEQVDISVGERARFYVFGGNEHGLVVYFHCQKGLFPAVAAEVQRLLDSVRFQQ